MHRTLGPRASLLQVTLGIITFPGQLASSHSNSLAEMGEARVKCLSQEHSIMTLPGLVSRLVAPESNLLVSPC